MTCNECKLAIEIPLVGLAVGGIILAAPEEIACEGVVAALLVLGFKFGKKTVAEWIAESVRDGANKVDQVAGHICKQAGAC